jgi:putative transposase
MTANKDLPNRRTPRRQGYDYSAAAIYFVTIGTRARRMIFGQVENGQFIPNRFGQAVQAVWLQLPRHYARVQLDSFTVMPNHVHGVLALIDPGAGLRPARSAARHGLSEIIRAFKGFSSRRLAELDHSLRGMVWQRGFYDHIVRNSDDLTNVRRYIFNNPAKWEFDIENTKSIKPEKDWEVF